jgi:hypothetical protein
MLSAFRALAPQQHGAHTVLTGLLDRSALYGVLAEIEAAWTYSSSASSPRTANHQDKVTTAHRDGHYHRVCPFRCEKVPLHVDVRLRR